MLLALTAFENGARSFRAANTPSFGDELSQQVLEISGVVFGAHCENEPLETDFGFLRSFSVFRVRVAVGLAFFTAVPKCPELRENGVFAVRISKQPHHGKKNGCRKKKGRK